MATGPGCGSRKLLTVSHVRGHRQKRKNSTGVCSDESVRCIGYMACNFVLTCQRVGWSSDWGIVTARHTCCPESYNENKLSSEAHTQCETIVCRQAHDGSSL